MNSAIDEMFEQAVRLPQIPHVMQEVVKSLRDEDVSIGALAALVSNDQVLAAKVLRLANSSYYGAKRNVSSINGAVQMLGLNVFRNLIVASSLVSSFPRVPGFDLGTFWRSSMLVANLAEIIGRNVKGADRETLFSAGLMHGLGQLLIYLCFPDEAQRAGEATAGLPLDQIREIEQPILNMDRFAVGMELARRWNFPDSLQVAIGHYDAPADDNVQAQIVHVAVIIAGCIQAGATFSDMLAAVPAAMAARLGIDRDWFEEEGEVFDLLLEESSFLISG